MRWPVALLLIGFSAYVALGQFVGLAQAIRRRRKDKTAGGYSMIPLIGGVCGMIGCFVAPSVTMQQLWWIPLVVDPGCALLFTATAVFLMWRYVFGRGKPPV
jgi:hypothetical protein